MSKATIFQADMQRALAEDLEVLGIAKGDTVLVRGALSSIDRKFIKLSRNLVDPILDYLGPSGSIMVLTFTRQVVLPQLRRNSPVFSMSSPPTSGGFSKQVLSHPSAIRSSHPTSSVAIAGNTEPWINCIQSHNVDAPEYEPIRRLIEQNGKLLVFGCVTSSPGFTTVHLAQMDLGLAKKHPVNGFVGCRYFGANGKIRTYTRRNFGGCSLGFGNLYSRYIEQGQFNAATFLGAPAISMPAKDAYEVDREALSSNPDVIRCADPGCIDCRVLSRLSNPDLLRFAATTLSRLRK